MAAALITLSLAASPHAQMIEPLPAAATNAPAQDKPKPPKPAQRRPQLAAASPTAGVLAQPVESWSVRTLKVPEEADWCVGKAKFDTGISLSIARSPQGEMAVVTEAFKPDKETGPALSVALFLDGVRVKVIESTYDPAGQLIVPVGRDAALDDKLRKAGRLVLSTPRGAAARFTLPEAGRLLEALDLCLQSAAKPAPPGQGQPGQAQTQVQPVSLPRDGATAPVSTPAPDAPKLPGWLGEMLIGAGLSDARLIDLAKQAGGGKVADFAWIGQGVVGMSRRVATPTDTGFAHFTRLYMERFRGSCTGAIRPRLGAIAERGTLLWRSAVAMCQGPQGDLAVGLMFVRRGPDAIDIVTHEMSGAAQPKLVALQQGLDAALRTNVRDDAQASATPPATQGPTQ